MSLLYLLQLVSPSLPVGAYSYSEGIETLVTQEKVRDAATLQQWLEGELNWGSIRLDAAIVLRSYQENTLDYWNQWLSAVRETEELRAQSHQMGYSLLRLIASLEPLLHQRLLTSLKESQVNFAVIFGALAAHWQITPTEAILGYLHSWANNLVGAGLKLIPLGQTQGQKILISLQPTLIKTVQEILTIQDESMYSCSWGLSLASMAHSTLYTRLFRS